MVLTREEFMDKVSKLITGNDDESIQLIEDFTDTYNDMELKSAGGAEDWKKKYEENDAAWRERYKKRFFTPEPDSRTREAFQVDKSDEDEVDIVDTGEGNLKYDDLFK